MTTTAATVAKPVPVIELFRDEDGMWLLVMPLVEGGDDLETLDTLVGLTRAVMSIRYEDKIVRLPVYSKGETGWVTWEDAFPVV
jgi:hypothetical protein